MRESKMLKVIGVIMIIGGALMVLMSLLALLGGALLATSSEFSGGLIMLLGIVALVSAVIELVAGILGVLNWNKPEKANTCFIMGIVLIVLNLLSNIGSIATSGFTLSMLFSIAVGLILPVLYTVGANQLKNAA